MALKTFNPTTPVAAPAGHRRPQRAVEGQAGQGVDRGAARARAGATTPAGSPCAGAAAATSGATGSSISSAPRTTCRRRSSGLNTIPTAPPSSRSSAIRMASSPTSWRRSGCKAGDSVVSRREGRRQARQHHADAQHAGRHDHPQRRDEARQGRADRALGRNLCPARRPRRRAMRCCGSRRASCAWCAPNAGRRSARCRTPTSRTSSSARPGAIAGSGGGLGARRRDEPDRSPAWRRRGPQLGRAPSGHPLGQADQGQEDASQQGDRRLIVRRRRKR